jgi:hypothetical protein
MADNKVVFDLAINTADAASSIKEVRQSIKALKDIQLEYGEGTEEFTKAAQKAGELKDKLSGVNDSLKNLSNSPVENVRNSFGTLSTQLRTLDFEGAKQSLKDLGASSGVLVKGILGLGPGINTATVAFRGLGAAIAATGIGALAIAIGVIVQNFDNIKESGGALGDVFTFIGETIDSVKTAMLELLVQFGLVDEAVLQDTESQKAYKESIDETRKSVDDLSLSLDKEVALLGKTGAEREKILLDQEIAAKKRELLSIDNASTSLQLYTEYQQLASKGIQNLTAQEKYRFEEIAKTDYFEIGKKVQEDLDKLDKIRQSKFSDIQKKQREDAIENAKKTAKESAEAELQALKDARKKQFEELGIAPIPVAPPEVIDTDEQAMIDKATAELDINQQLIDGKKAQKEAEDEYYKVKREQELKDEQELNELKVQAVYNGLSTIADLAQAFAGQSEKSQERAFNIQKAVNIASTIIDTYQSATAAYKSLAGIPIIGPALGGIAAGAAVAAGLANVQRIRQQQFRSSSAAGGGGTQQNISSPNSTLQTQTSISPGQFTGFGEFKPGELEDRRVYVVESDITGVQRKIQVIEDRSKF